MNFLTKLFPSLSSDSPLGHPVFAIIDTETTGFNKRYDRIIELAVARFDQSFRLVDQWHTLINPDGKQIKNSHIHNISNTDVACAPLFSEVYTDFSARLDGMVLLAHNASFDAKMIEAEVDRIPIPNGNTDDAYFPFVDTIDLAKQIVDLRSYKLETLLNHVGLENQQSHAAITDATATGLMLHRLFGRKATQIGQKIIDGAVTFNAEHAARWNLPTKPTHLRAVA